MAGERERSEGGDDGGDGGEDGDLDEDLRADGAAETDEFADACGFITPFGFEEAVAVAAVVVEDGGEHDGGLIAAGERGGPARAGDSVGRDVDGTPVVTVDEEPVEEDVDEVGGDEREGDGADVIEGLQVAAEDEPQEQHGRSPVEGVEERDGAAEDLGVGVEMGEPERQQRDDGHEDDGEDGSEDEAVLEGTVGVVDAFGAEGLGEDGVEAE